ncbi:MAG: lytic transglycosylase domain-containing protein, partial [Alcaligenes sp.]
MGIDQLKYQKTRGWGTPPAFQRPSLSTLLVVAVGLAGCAGAEQPQAQATTSAPTQQISLAAPALPPAKEAARRWDSLPPVPPVARQALIEAREAVNAKR